MRTLTIELPPHAVQTEFNLRRWDELLADPEVAKLEFRIETDRFGNIIMSPPPAPNHGRLQLRAGQLIAGLMPSGVAYTECPISTADGVRAADVAWASQERAAELGSRSCFSQAPELCVEILSPSNSEPEILEKISLYFDAGAKEVWTCDSFGNMIFFGAVGLKLEASKLCPAFPANIERSE